MAIEDETLGTEKESGDKTPAFLIGIQGADCSHASAMEYLAELRELVNTLGIPVAGEKIVSVRQINAKFYVGSGKIQELKAEAAAHGASILVFDCELGPSQQRNIEKECAMKVFDRQEVILDIFADRARTREAVLQVELARNRYYLPRLTGAWSHLSRQRGGALGTRGEGEKQIEYDRRMVKRRISALEEELKLVRKQRTTQRKGRLRNPIRNCAIIGYTNAGKSSLLNALTNAGVTAEDKLFATLDPTTRRLVLPDKQELLLTDTVGFVRKLPHTLVEAFKSTLEEAVIADFLLLVLDVSSPHMESHWETTLSVLSELSAADKKMLVVFNKCDLQKDPVVLARIRSIAPDGIFISCVTKEGFPALLSALSLYSHGQSCILELEIPPSRSDIIALLHSRGHIYESSWSDSGQFEAVANVPAECRGLFAPYAKGASGSGTQTDNQPAPENRPEQRNEI